MEHHTGANRAARLSWAINSLEEACTASGWYSNTRTRASSRSSEALAGILMVDPTRVADVSPRNVTSTTSSRADHLGSRCVSAARATVQSASEQQSTDLTAFNWSNDSRGDLPEGRICNPVWRWSDGTAGSTASFASPIVNLREPPAKPNAKNRRWHSNLLGAGFALSSARRFTRDHGERVVINAL